MLQLGLRPASGTEVTRVLSCVNGLPPLSKENEGRIQVARFVQRSATRHSLDAPRFHLIGPCPPPRDEQIAFVRHWCGELGVKNVTVVDCYALAARGCEAEWEQRLADVLFPRHQQPPEWIHLDGFEALFLGFAEPDADTIGIDVHANNFGRVSFGVLGERFLRRRTWSFGGVVLPWDGAASNVFLQMARAGPPTFPVGCGSDVPPDVEAPSPPQQWSPGDYVTTARTGVNDTVELTPKDLLAILPKGAAIRVTEVSVRGDLRRVRARIASPAGWVSLQQLDTGKRWAQPAQ